MANSMIMFNNNTTQFVLCVRGISIHENQLLLFTTEGIGMDCWALPGGRVEMKEESEDALRREMQEELGTCVKVGRLVWIVENFFKDRGRFYHEIGMFYIITLPRNASIFNTNKYYSTDGGVKLIFRLFPLSELDNIDLRPTFLRKALQKMPKHPGHIVWKDN